MTRTVGTRRGEARAGEARIGRRHLLRSMVAAPLLAAAGVRVARAQRAPMTVTATTGMIADIVGIVAGDRAVVQGIMGRGVDPHSYRQTRADVARFAASDAVFWNGLYLEAQLEKLLLTLDQTKPVFAVGEAVPAELLRHHDTYENRYDPHVWMDPTLWRHAVDAVEQALISLDPEGADAFTERATAYRAELRTLDAYARAVVLTVPEQSRLLVTAHDAFAYFGHRYGFQVVGVQGISTESEAGLARVREVVELIVERRVTAVFAESSVSDRNVRALIEGAASEGWAVALGGQLFSDAMGSEGTYEGTYIGMIDHNVTTIARALGGAAPKTGRVGRLQEIM